MEHHAMMRKLEGLKMPKWATPDDKRTEPLTVFLTPEETAGLHHLLGAHLGNIP